MLVGVAIGLMTSLAFILASSLRRGFQLIHEGHVGGLVHRIELASQTSFLNRARLATTLARFKKDDQVVLDARLADYIDPDILSLMQEFATASGPARGVRVSTMGFQQRYPMQDVVQFVDWTTREMQASLTPDRVVQLLREGNERFLTGRRLSRDLARQIDATSEGQHPMAVVLSCIDSRSAAELLFDVGLGDIFNCRLAGNVASERVLGSMEFACKVAGAKLIVVLGHTSCGAVKASCDFVAKGVDAATATGLTNLGSITDTIAHAVKSPGAHQHVGGPRDASNKDFVDSVAAENVRLTMRWIPKNSPVLATMLAKGEIGMVGAMYDISTGRVDFLPAVT
jgi:carbonic anhydrase/SulP family sulfate permease